MTGATVTIDTSQTNVYVPGATGYSTIFLKQGLHELGHTMGLTDAPLPEGGNGCDQTDGASVMNYTCNANDSAGNEPTEVQQCDKDKVAINYPSCPTPTPTPDEEIIVIIPCPTYCRPYQLLDAGGCFAAVDYCTYVLFGCPEGTTDGGDGCCCYPTPILIDVSGNGFALSSAQNGVHFDMGGDGHAEPIAWTRAGSDNAWLCLDRNGNGTIDSGKELFGNFTDQPHATTSRNGFVALAEFDRTDAGGNGDGVIDKKDAIFHSLLLWQDTNHNGISEPSEVHTLRDLGLKMVDLDYKTSRRTDQHGNQFRYRAKIKDTHDAQLGRWAWDVILQVNPEPSR